MTTSTAPGKTLRLMIRDVARDVTHFQHPGGDTLSHYTDGQDATDAFETFHNRSHIAEARLRSLPEVELPRGVYERAMRKGEELAAGEKGRLFNEGGGLVLDREGREINNALGRLRDDLRAEGMFELHPYPLLHFLTCYLAHDIALYALALALVLNGWIACGMILRAFAHVQRGGTMHDLGHNEVFGKSASADRCFMWFTNLSMGFSAHEWRTKHNRHHTSPNMEGYDGNVEQLPLFGWNKGWTKRMTLRMQKAQLYAWYAATPLLGIVMQVRGMMWARKKGLGEELRCVFILK